jgi:phage shock protein A
MSDEAPNAQADPVPSAEETDRLALAAIEAIKRLIAERNALRHEVTRLRDQVALVRNSYRRLANELVTQLQLIDNLDGQVAEKPAAELHWLRGVEQTRSDI